MHWLHLETSVLVPGQPPGRYFSWEQPDPPRREYQCWTEQDWFGPRRVCRWVDLPPTFTHVNNLGRPLPEGDTIRIRESSGTPGWVEFVLSVAYYITWWKGIKVRTMMHSLVQDADVFGSGSVAPLQPDDAHRSAVLRLPLSWLLLDIASGYGQYGVVQLGKARFLGSYEYVYMIVANDLVPFDGQRLQFHWVGD